MNPAHSTLSLYLTDRQTPAEADDLGRTVLLDHRVFEELLLEETELVDHYVRGELEPETRRSLRDRMQKSDLLRERIEFASLLAEVARESPGEEARYGLATGWRVVGGLTSLFLVVAISWWLWGPAESQMPSLLAGFAAWIGLCAAVVGSLRWHATRERLRDRLVGLERLFTESDDEATDAAGVR